MIPMVPPDLTFNHFPCTEFRELASFHVRHSGTRLPKHRDKCYPSQVIVSTAITLRREQALLCTVSSAQRQEDFPLYLLLFPVPMGKSLLFSDFWWEGKKGGCPQTPLETGWGRADEGLVRSCSQSPQNNSQSVLHGYWIFPGRYLSRSGRSNNL